MLNLVKNKVSEYQNNIDEFIKDIKSVENKENYEKVQKLIKKHQNKAVGAIIKLKDSSEVKKILNKLKKEIKTISKKLKSKVSVKKNSDIKKKAKKLKSGLKKTLSTLEKISKKTKSKDLSKIIKDSEAINIAKSLTENFNTNSFADDFVEAVSPEQKCVRSCSVSCSSSCLKYYKKKESNVKSLALEQKKLDEDYKKKMLAMKNKLANLEKKLNENFQNFSYNIMENFTSDEEKEKIRAEIAKVKKNMQSLKNSYKAATKKLSYKIHTLNKVMKTEHIL
jgi:hypothetical protein